MWPLREGRTGGKVAERLGGDRFSGQGIELGRAGTVVDLERREGGDSD
jgi:hypothetical protein